MLNKCNHLQTPTRNREPSSVAGFLEQRNPERFVMNVIWTDENLFCLNQKTHRENYGIWSHEFPHEIVGKNNRNDHEVMLFVAIVDGKVLCSAHLCG